MPDNPENTYSTKKVLHVFGRMVRGGAEMRTVEVFARMRSEGFDFIFCALSGAHGTLDDDIRSLGGKVVYLKPGLDFPFAFTAMLRNHQIDIVHSHVHLFSGVIMVLAAFANVPVRISHFRNTDDGRTGTLLRSLRNIILLQCIRVFATKILAVAEGVMESVLGSSWRLNSKCQVVYNGLDTERFRSPVDRLTVRSSLGIDPDATMYIHVGRMAVQKNHRQLLYIFKEILRHDPSAFLVLVGRADHAICQELQEISVKSGLSDHIKFLGERDDVPSLLAASDLMLFPSLWEGLPGAVLEACAAGIPVLASDLPGVREIASHFTRSVTIKSLKFSAREWAQTARNIVSSVDSLTVENRTVQSLGPFDLNRCCEILASNWRPQPPESVYAYD